MCFTDQLQTSPRDQWKTDSIDKSIQNLCCRNGRRVLAHSKSKSKWGSFLSRGILSMELLPIISISFILPNIYFIQKYFWKTKMKSIHMHRHLLFPNSLKDSYFLFRVPENTFSLENISWKAQHNSSASVKFVKLFLFFIYSHVKIFAFTMGKQKIIFHHTFHFCNITLP